MRLLIDYKKTRNIMNKRCYAPFIHNIPSTFFGLATRENYGCGVKVGKCVAVGRVALGVKVGKWVPVGGIVPGV